MDGLPVDRVPVMCAGLEDRTANEIMGKPIIPPKALFRNPFMKHVLNNHQKISTHIAHNAINGGMEKHTKAAIRFGFDAMWLACGENMVILDYDTMANINGLIYNLIEDGYGNMSYMYRGPAIRSSKDFEEWPYFESPDDYAQRIYKFYKRMLDKYGEDICIFACPCGGLQDSLLLSVGIGNAPLWMKKEKKLTEQYLDWCSDIIFNSVTAVLDAGAKVILIGDDFAQKTGPFFGPKMVNEVFGPFYRKVIKAVHARSARMLLHSCGDNTLLFDTFISWGFDGFHAFEPTSNVDIYSEKRLHGDRITIMGNVGVDYLLTERSTAEEVVEEVRRLIDGLAQGGRYILAAAHSIDTVPRFQIESHGGSSPCIRRILNASNPVNSLTQTNHEDVAGYLL